jgi:hypothetical protein
MNVSAFNIILKSLQEAEGRCINHLNELAFQANPAWKEIDRGFLLVNEFHAIQVGALEALASYPSGLQNSSTFTSLKQSVLIYSECLQILDDLCRRYRTRP